MRAPREHPEGDVLVGRPLQPARRADAQAVAVQHERHHHPGVPGALPAVVLPLVDPLDPRQVEALDHVEHEVDEVALREPVAHRGREQEDTIRLPGAVRLLGHVSE